MIRLATHEDVSRIREIAQSLELFDYGSWIYRKLTDNQCIHVLTAEDSVVGYVIAFPLWATIIFCLQIGVIETQQSKGIGNQLMTDLHRRLIKDKKTTIYAHTLREKSYQYFSSKFSYLSVFRVGWLRIIKKRLP